MPNVEENNSNAAADVQASSYAASAKSAVLLSRVKADIARHRQESREISEMLRGLASAPANDDRPLSPRDQADLDQAVAVLDTIEDTPRRVSRNPKKRPRTSRARDRRTRCILPGYEADVRPLAGRPSVATPITSSDYYPTVPETKRQKADENDKRNAPAWRYTTEIAKGACAFRTVSITGPGIAFTLNIGGKVLEACNDNPKKAKTLLHDRLDKSLKVTFGNDNPKKAKTLLHDRLDKSLKVTFGEARDFAFRLEVTKGGRLHLHGVIDANVQERESLEEALCRAGGEWIHKYGKEHQAHTRPVFSADGWNRYTEKDDARTRRTLGIDSTLSMTRGCRRRAEVLWESSRWRAL